MKSLFCAALSLTLLLVTQKRSAAWSAAGHETVLAVALQIDPTLRPRLAAILKDLPSSKQWQDLKASGLKPDNAYELEKEDEDGWVKALVNHVEKAATFPDWARDYKDYGTLNYAMWHFYDLNYNDATDESFVEKPNALTVLGPFEQDLKLKTGGDRAWALVWILHIVGDLHQPLHCCTRPIPNQPGKADHGGNAVSYEHMKLHAFWDNLPDHMAGGYPKLLAASVLSLQKNFTAAQKLAFEARAADLEARHWVEEGHGLITGIGYPSDKKVQNYDEEAHRIAEEQLLVAGARLAKILQRDLPP
jgi:hypothetical protein